MCWWCCGKKNREAERDGQIEWGRAKREKSQTIPVTAAAEAHFSFFVVTFSSLRQQGCT